MFTIETNQLRRAFDGRVAVAGLPLAIPAGSIHPATRSLERTLPDHGPAAA